MVKNSKIMKKNFRLILSMALTLVLMYSCRKQENLDVVDFSVTTADSVFTFRVDDTVKFSIAGNPDVIAFYSGEPGHDYDFRNRIYRNDGQLKFSFQSRLDNNAGFRALLNGGLKVLFSNSFPSTYSTSTDSAIAVSQDSTFVNSNNYWTDITNRFFIPTSGTTGTFYPSNEALLSDLVTNPNYPINIAFKYSSPSTGYLSSNGITIGILNLYNKYPDSSQVSFNLEPGGSVSNVWKVIKAANPANAWATSTTQLKFKSDSTALYSEDWAISTSIYPNAVKPDLPIAIKNISNNPLRTYAYKFAATGTYKVVFVASNNRVGNINEITKEIIINIVP